MERPLLADRGLSGVINPRLELSTDLEVIFDYQVVAKVAFTTPAL